MHDCIDKYWIYEFLTLTASFLSCNTTNVLKLTARKVFSCSKACQAAWKPRSIPVRRCCTVWVQLLFISIVAIDEFGVAALPRIWNDFSYFHMQCVSCVYGVFFYFILYPFLQCAALCVRKFCMEASEMVASSGERNGCGRPLKISTSNQAIDSIDVRMWRWWRYKV